MPRSSTIGSRKTGAAAARLPDPAPRAADRARGTECGTVAGLGAPIPGRRAAHAALASALGGRAPRCPDRARIPRPRAARAALDRPRSGGAWVVARAREALESGRVPLRLGAGSGAAQHRRARPAARASRRGGWSAPPQSRGAATADARGHRPGWAGDGRLPGRQRRASGTRPDRRRALSRVGLHAADGGARCPGQHRRGAARVSTRLRTLLREELGTMPSPQALAMHETLLQPAATRGQGRAAHGRGHPGPDRAAARARRPRAGRARRDARPSWPRWTRLWGSGDRPRVRRGRRRPLTRSGPGGRAGRRSGRGQDAFGRRARAPRPSRGGGGAGRPLARGEPPALSAVPRGAAPLRRSRSAGGAAAHRAGVRRRAGAPGPRVAPARARARSARFAVDPDTERYRLFEARRRAARGDLAQCADPARPRRPAMGRPPVPAAAAPPRARVGSAPAADSRRLPGDRDARRRAGLDARRPAPRAAGHRAEHRRLSEEETAELVRVRTGETPGPAFARALHEETEGNPLFIEEMVRHLGEAGVRPRTPSPPTCSASGCPRGSSR